ncbi:MAG: bicyclomycin resistance protein, partial [Rhizobacter sp.]|nr:bicyclomycin resistance protein [Rhizobacter sp.]
ASSAAGGWLAPAGMAWAQPQAASAAESQAPQAAASQATSAATKVYRFAFPTGETGFDPAQVSDLYSRIITAHIFDGLYGYDHLARPFKVKPNVAVGMPEVSADFRTWTVRLQRGIYFADDPAFKGKRRELVAQDYVFTFKRFFDPASKSQHYSSFSEEGVVGLEALRNAAIKSGKPLDYEREIEGVRAIDRYTLQFKLEQPRPRFIYTLATGDLFGAMAREVVDFYGDDIMAHPVGTGPFRLTQWRRSSLIVLERNPGFRELIYDAEPNADDAAGQAMLAQFKGRKLPMIDRVEVSIINESQPRWLAFLNGQLDSIGVPLEFANLAVPGGKLAPNLAKRGIKMERTVGADRTVFYFNMEDPTVGGYTPEKVALRRAIGLSVDIEREITVARRGQAIPAQSVISPSTYGYDPTLKTENSDYDPARAKALLDMYGYVDRDGDGWREMPDGKPLVIAVGTQADQISRQFDELWKKNMDAVGIRLRFDIGQWPEQLKKARAGQLMVWGVGYSAGSPDGQDGLQSFYGPAAGSGNLSRFKLKAFDSLYERMGVMPDGPERLALMREAVRLLVAYMPEKVNVHRIGTDLTQPWLLGFRRPVFWLPLWQYLDIAPDRPLNP